MLCAYLILFFLFIFNPWKINRRVVNDRSAKIFHGLSSQINLYKGNAIEAIVQTTILRRTKFTRRSPAIIFSKITPTDYPTIVQVSKESSPQVPITFMDSVQRQKEWRPTVIGSPWHFFFKTFSTVFTYKSGCQSRLLPHG